MGKRYHCDYCDKTFPDSANNRKKHLQGTFHTRMKRLHYDAFRDAETVFKVESVKKPCRRFQQVGECDYGTACKFSHLSPGELAELAARAEAEKHAAKLRLSKPLPADVTVIEWTHTHLKTQEKLPEPFAYQDMIAKQFSSLNNSLSRSMQAPTLDDFLACRPNHWG
ncbi:zinc finger matrin-type protein 5-like [Dermacentor silvarum]|uniref:zinc finger matrin-type protein 5-like n=1 Tax=Dermacentor silvarum TaxID=543639 RepID=UPI001899C2F4|nr:zinc finger matrin-type protein 5-like [Dermacentor silvarum]